MYFRYLALGCLVLLAACETQPQQITAVTPKSSHNCVATAATGSHISGSACESNHVSTISGAGFQSGMRQSNQGAGGGR